VPLGAAAALFLNDHWWKHAGLAPAWLTGKLSDFAGLFVAPLVLCALLGLVWPGAALFARRLAIASALATGLVFSAVKLWPPANALASRVLGPMVLDPTDLIALPALVASFLWLTRNGLEPRQPRRVHLWGLAATTLACIATSPAPYTRNYPAWEIDADPTSTVGCLASRLWIAKSGKEGLGVALALRNSATDRCVVAIERAALTVGTQTIVAPSIHRELSPGETAYAYLPFAFDGNAAWNLGQRTAALTLCIDAGQERAQKTLPLTFRLRGFQKLSRWGRGAAP
jgi:hypothetical protein